MLASALVSCRHPLPLINKASITASTCSECRPIRAVEFDLRASAVTSMPMQPKPAGHLPMAGGVVDGPGLCVGLGRAHLGATCQVCR